MFRRFRSQGPSRLASKREIQRYKARPDARYLVSFPRTGSHWLRMISEQYADRPTLVRAFYQHPNDDYLFLHVHDVDLDFEAVDVMYLFRQPLPTVYSTVKYYSVEGESEVRKWATLYGAHLHKWLLDERFTQRKLLLRYEDLPGCFASVAQHLGLQWEPQRLAEVAAVVTPEHVRERTPHDPQVMQRDAAYTLQSEDFTDRYRQLVEDCVFGQAPELRRFFT